MTFPSMGTPQGLKIAQAAFSEYLAALNRDGSHPPTLQEVTGWIASFPHFPRLWRAIANEAYTPPLISILNSHPQSVSPEAIRALVEACTEGSGPHTGIELRPLHVACRKKAPLEVVRVLTEAFPDALLVQGVDSGPPTTPLQYLLDVQGPLTVLEYFCSQWGDKILPGSFQRSGLRTSRATLKLTALRYAIQAGVPLPYLQCLASYHPELLQSSNGGGPVRAYSIADRDFTVLHFAMRMSGRVSLEMVDWLLEQQPSAVREYNSLDELPLFLVLQNRGSAHNRAIVQRLVRVWPESITALKKGLLALDYAAMDWRRKKDSFAFIPLLLGDELPLFHFYFESGGGDAFSSTNTVDWLLAYGESQNIDLTEVRCAHFGNLAYHQAIMGNASNAVLFKLEDYNPSSPRRLNHEGQTSLHIAAIGSMRPEVVQMLIDKDEGTGGWAAIDAKDDEGKLPLHHAAEHSDWSTVRVLLDAKPDSACVQDWDGWYPFQLAAQNEYIDFGETASEDDNTCCCEGKVDDHLTLVFNLLLASPECLRSYNKCTPRN